MSNYLNVFTESAWVASVIPLGSEPSFFAMAAFGTFSMFPAWVAAVAGGTLGHIFNYCVGRLIAKLSTNTKINNVWLLRLHEYFVKYGVFILLLAWVPMFNMFVVLAGAVKISPRIALPLIIAGLAFHYGMYIL